MHLNSVYIYIYKHCLHGVARDKLDMSNSFEEFIVILKSLKLKVKLRLHIYYNALYISKHIPKTKPKSYYIPITNPNHITPATNTMVFIIIAKVNNIPVSPSNILTKHITFPLLIPSQYSCNSYVFTIIDSKRV